MNDLHLFILEHSLTSSLLLVDAFYFSLYITDDNVDEMIALFLAHVDEYGDVGIINYLIAAMWYAGQGRAVESLLERVNVDLWPEEFESESLLLDPRRWEEARGCIALVKEDLAAYFREDYYDKYDKFKRIVEVFDRNGGFELVMGKLFRVNETFQCAAKFLVENNTVSKDSRVFIEDKLFEGYQRFLLLVPPEEIMDLSTDFGQRVLHLKMTHMWAVGLIYPPPLEKNTQEWIAFARISKAVHSVLERNQDLFEGDIDFILLAAQFYLAAYNLDFAESVDSDLSPVVENYLAMALNLDVNDPSTSYLAGLYLMLTADFNEDTEKFLERAVDNGLNTAIFPLLEYYFITGDYRTGIQKGTEAMALFPDNQDAIEALETAINQLKNELLN